MRPPEYKLNLVKLRGSYPPLGRGVGNKADSKSISKNEEVAMEIVLASWKHANPIGTAGRSAA